MDDLLVFLDETYPSHAGAEILAVGAVGVFASDWPAYAEEFSRTVGIRAKRRLKAIRDFVAQRQLLATVGGTRLDLLGVTPRAKGDSEGGSRLAPRDVLWSHIATYTAAALLRKALEQGWHIGPVRMRYDSKSMKTEMAKEMHETFRSEIANWVRGQGPPAPTTFVADIGPVSKAGPGATSNLEQLGTLLAHWVVRLPHEFGGPTMPPNVHVFDFAATVANAFK